VENAISQNTEERRRGQTIFTDTKRLEDNRVEVTRNGRKEQKNVVRLGLKGKTRKVTAGVGGTSKRN